MMLEDTAGNAELVARELERGGIAAVSEKT